MSTKMYSNDMAMVQALEEQCVHLILNEDYVNESSLHSTAWKMTTSPHKSHEKNHPHLPTLWHPTEGGIIRRGLSSFAKNA